MRIAILGGSGFIGSHLCEELTKKHKVISYDNYSTGSRSNHVPGVEYIEGHSKDFDIKADLIYHLGEYPRVLTSFEDIDKVIESNLVGTAHVLEFCRKNKIKLVYAGSSTRFGDAESPYSYIKQQNAELIKRYGAWFGLKYSIAYFYNVYGGREIREGRFATVIGKFTDNKLKGLPHKVNGGSQKRMFTHIDDIVRGLILASQSEGEFCIGNPKEYSILEVAKMFGGGIEIEPCKKGDRTHSKIDLTNIKKLGWKPIINLEDYVRTI